MKQSKFSEKKKEVIKAIKDSFTVGDLVRNIPCEVPLCDSERTIQIAAGNVCEKHALEVVERTYD